MKQQIISEVMQQMLPHLDNAQMQQLQKTLENALFGCEITVQIDVGRQGQTARTGRGEDVLDGLLLAGLRLHRSRHASQGHRLEGEPQRPAVVPRGADIQYRRDVRDRLPALRPAKAGALRTRFQGRW